MGPVHNPLNDEHLIKINAALNAVKVAQSQIILAKQAGIDVGSLERDIAEQEMKLRAIKNTYFPGR